MIKLIKSKVNAIRLNINSAFRKYTIQRNLDNTKIQHLEKTIRSKYKWYGTSYGGFNIMPQLLNETSIVYSFGMGKDISFDRKVMKNHHCKVYGFDPTPVSINWIKEQKIPELFYFYDYGISTKNEMKEFYIPVNPKYVSGSLIKDNVTIDAVKINVLMKSFDQITTEMGHRHVDVLKMDIEGSEYDVLANILESSVTVDQILVEFHDRLFEGHEYKSKNIVEQMKRKGYEIFAASMSYEEISFVHQRKVRNMP